MKHRYFTQEQIDAINEISILDYLQTQPVTVYQKGKHVFVREIEGLNITPDGKKWHSFYDAVGGGIIQFVMWYQQEDWIKAVKTLLPLTNGIVKVKERSPPKIQVENKIPKKKDVVLPEKAARYNNLFAYLNKTRKISQSVIQHFVHTRQLYQDIHQNCVFVGFDTRGKPVSAFKRSSQDTKKFVGVAEGNDNRFGFVKEGSNTVLRVFESPIDLMSYLTIGEMKHKDYLQTTDDHFIALNGLKYQTLKYYIETHPTIDTIVFCVDRDQPDKRGIRRGEQFIQDTTKYILEEMPKRFYSLKQFKNGMPPYGKDWNDTLKMMVKRKEETQIKRKVKQQTVYR